MIEGPGRRLVVRLAEEADGAAVLLFHEHRDAEPRFEGFGLTSREREVALWIAHGKTNPEIGLILGISSRTVDKHEERILRKLGVENRAGVIRQAFSSRH